MAVNPFINWVRRHLYFQGFIHMLDDYDHQKALAEKILANLTKIKLMFGL